MALVDAVGGGFARPTFALSTNGTRPHSPAAWAQAVAFGMIGIDPDMPLERRAVAFNVRQQVALVLLRAFEALLPRTSADDITLLAEGCVDDIRQIFIKTLWSFEADSEHVRTEFQRYIRLNLLDAARLIKRSEF